jgi:hypothetical protein
MSCSYEEERSFAGKYCPDEHSRTVFPPHPNLGNIDNLQRRKSYYLECIDRFNWKKLFCRFDSRNNSSLLTSKTLTLHDGELRNCGQSSLFPSPSRFPSAMNLPSFKTIRRSIIGAGLISTGLVVSHFVIKLQANEFQSSLEAEVELKREAVAQRPYLERLEEIAERDREVLAETKRWSSLIDATTRKMLASDTFSVSTPTFHADIPERFEGHWASQSLQRTTVPPCNNPNARNPIDHFIEAKLQTANESLGALADNQHLTRRLHLSIIGMLPEESELRSLPPITADEADSMVDRLLQSRHFGEHWAQYWLDLARYADSNGYEEDEIRPQSYVYRDFVIWALNHNLPWDQFLRWQIAGDELQYENPLAVAATGFLTAAPYNTFMPQESERFDELDDIVSTVGSAMLGVSVGCARCHDHPYDDIAIDEYYSLVSIFRNTQRKNGYLDQIAGEPFRDVDLWKEEVHEILLDSARDDNIEDLDLTDDEKAILKLPLDPTNKEQLRLLSMCDRCLMVDDSYIDEDSEPAERDRERYELLVEKIDAAMEVLPTAPLRGLVIKGSDVTKIPVLWGGSLFQPGDKVGPRFPGAFAIASSPDIHKAWQSWDPNNSSPKPRSAFAHWITDLQAGAGSLAARVAVNRVWLHYFGLGLVDTPSNFGREGSEPSHPKLLEWLACELVDSGWNIRHIHRLILCSATFRQASQRDDNVARDLFHRWWPQRMTAEMFRDSLLQLSGLYNDRMYGPAFHPPIPRAAILNRHEDDPDETWPTVVIERPEIHRRSIYILKKRTNPLPFLQLFDSPGGLISCPQRQDTTVPTQSLALWNDSVMRMQAQQIAARAFADSKYHLEPAIQRLFLRLLGRNADQQEVERIEEFLNQGNELGDFAQVLLMSNEFWYFN